MMSDKQLILPVNPDDDWHSVSDIPDRNGWYDVWVRRTVKGRAIDLTAVRLYHDGWTEGNFIAWKYPVRMKDLTGVPIRDSEAAVHLAEVIVDGICRDYEEFYKASIDSQISPKERAHAILACRAREGLIRSPYFVGLSMGAADPDTVIRVLQQRVRRWMSVNEK